jgi:hypothetical protein
MNIPYKPLNYDFEEYINVFFKYFLEEQDLDYYEKRTKVRMDTSSFAQVSLIWSKRCYIDVTLFYQYPGFIDIKYTLYLDTYPGVSVEYTCIPLNKFQEVLEKSYQQVKMLINKNLK